MGRGGAVIQFPRERSFNTFNISHISVLPQFLPDFNLTEQQQPHRSDAGGVRQYLGRHHGDGDVGPGRALRLRLPVCRPLLPGLLLDGLVAVPAPLLSHRGSHAGGLRCEPLIHLSRF